MVAIVSGFRAGLELSSRAVLGQAGTTGNASEGTNGQSVFVNVGTGSLVVQNQDDYVAARGSDHAVLRTYNSSGALDDDNGDQWRADQLTLKLQGTLNTIGSTLVRYDRDGSAAVYAYDSARGLYQSAEGAGAYDTISYLAAANQFEYRDGTSGITERFEGSGAYRILSRKDTSGNTLTYGYDAAGLLRYVTTPTNETFYYDYAGGNLTQVRMVSGATTTTRVRYAYDTSNRLTTVTLDLTPTDNSVADGKTYETRYTYDGTSKRVASITQTDGSSLAIGYVDVGGGNYKVASIRDALNQVTTFAYGAGYATVTDALNLTTRYEFDAANQLLRVLPPAVAGASATRQFAYGGSGDVVRVTDGEGRSMVFEYDAQGNRVLQRDALGNTVKRTFDGRNQMLTETAYLVPDPDAAGTAQAASPLTTRYVYDASGRNLLRFVVSAEGNVTEHRYNGFGDRTSTITYAGGSYPVAGLAEQSALSETDLLAWAGTQNLAATQRVDFVYDGRQQLQTRTTYATVSSAGDGVAGFSVEYFTYDRNGRLLQTISPGNGSTTYAYDGLDRRLTSTDALGRTTVTTYDDAARKTTVTLVSGRVTTQTFDAAGRLSSVSESSTAGAALGETKYFYDAGNRLRMTQDPTGVRNWFLYHENGLKLADIDGNGTLTEYVYDRSERLISTIRRGNAVSTAALVDGTGMPVLAVSIAGIRPAASLADQTSWQQYDAAGRLVRAAEQVGTDGRAAVTETRYDGASRIVQVVRYGTTIPTDGSTGSPEPGSVPLPAASTLDRSTRSFYDADGRLAGTLDAEGYLTVHKYTPAGQPAERIAHALVTDAALRASGTLAQLQPAAHANDVREFMLHDGKGQRVAHVDGERYLTESVYDAEGRLAQSIRYANRVAAAATSTSTLVAIRPASSPQDRQTSYSYDLLGRLQQQTDPEGTVTKYTYDAAGNLVSTEKALGTAEVRTLLARYDAPGRLVAELSAEGATKLTGGQTQAQIDAIWAQHGTSHSYDAAGRRTSSVGPAGQRTFFFYNSDGALTHRVNALGEVDETRYDARGRTVERIAYGTRISTSGLAGGLVPASLTTLLTAIANASLDSRTTLLYTRDGNVASTTDAAGAVTSSTFNAFGDEVTRTLTGVETNLLETYTVDRRGQRTGAVSNAAQINAVTTAVYDAFGRLARTVDANGKTTVQVYDKLGRVVTSIDPLNAYRVSTFDAFARILTSKDPTGNTTTYAYDKTARTMKVTTPEGIVTTTAYNRHGQVQSVTDGRGQVRTYVYDADGRLKTTKTPANTTATNVYDTSGRLAETWDANGKRVSYTYDAASRVLTRTVDPGGLGLKTTYAYDAKGQRVSITDPNLVVTTIEYDLKGRVWKQTVDPTGLKLQTVYSYDGRDNALTVTSPSGTVTRYVYDALGRRKQEIVDPGRLNLVRSWDYDKKGNVVASTDANGYVTRFVYDAGDRRVYTVNALGEVRQEAYDAAGRLIKVTAFAKRIVPGALGTTPTVLQVQSLVTTDATDAVQHSVYDKDGRLAATVDGAGGVTRHTYDANGNVTARVAYANRINLAAWVPGTLPTVAADDARDQRVTTLYDALDRASYVVDGTRALVAFKYDANGNVLERMAYAKAVLAGVALTEAAILAALPTMANAETDAVERNTYDAANRVVTTTDGTRAVRKRIYFGQNLVQVIAYWTPLAVGGDPATVPTSERDRVTSYAYDKANRLTLTVDATKAVIERVHDAEGQVVREIAYATPIGALPSTLQSATAEASVRALLQADASRDRSTRHAFDAAGRAVLTIGAEGAVVEKVYDGAGQVVKRVVYAKLVDASALPSRTSTDSLRALIQVDAAQDRSTGYARDAAGRLAYEVDALNRVARNRYDGLGRLLETRRFDQDLPVATAVSVTALDAALVEGANDRWEKHGYDAAGNRLTTTDALNSAESWTYDGLGNQLSFVNKKGALWTYVRDAAGRMVKETSPAVDLATSALDALNLKLTTTSSAAVQVITVMRYDALGNLVERVEAEGRPERRSTRYEYDAAGRQIRVLFPPVGVYDAAGDSNLSMELGVHARADTALKTLETRTYYDALGNAVANRDVGGALTQKAYDLAGRVMFEIDALGYVTGYTYNGFGEATALTRYASKTSLAGRSVSTASQAVSHSEVAAALTAPGFSHVGDRTVTSTYDRLGRVVETTQPEEYVFDATLAEQAFVGSARTRNTYNSFGDLVQVSKVRDKTGASWYSTTHYFDQLGREKATVDAAGFLTGREYDRFGNLAQVKEYATALPAASWSLASCGNVPASVDEDRTTTYAYDALDRKTKETRVRVQYSNASDGTSLWGDLVTTFGYDAVGNQTQQVDATGQATWTYYDALGRIQAVATPFSGATKSLTVFKRDAHGNEIAKVEHVTPVTPAASSFPVVPVVEGDRQTITRFDALGRALEVQDANGNVAFTSYDAYGNLAKSWRGVTDAENQTRTRFQVNVYDAVGHLVETRTPASTTVVQGGVKATYWGDPAPYSSIGTISNRLLLEWSDIVDVQGGAVRVEVDYLTLATTTYNLEGEAQSQDAHLATVTKDLSAAAAGGGAEIYWSVATDKVAYIRVRQLVGSTWSMKWEGSLANAKGAGVNVLTQAEAGLVFSTQQFNAFGEVTQRGTQGTQEYFEYDSAGRLWRTNSGDGVDKVRLYDLQGNVTSEIRSSGSGGLDQDVKAYANAQSAGSDSNTRRVDTAFNAVGHVTSRTDAIRSQTQGGVSFQRQFVTASFQSATPVDLESVASWEGSNQITVGWNNVAALGSGDLMVTIDYTTPVTQQGGDYDDFGNRIPITFTGGVARTYQTALVNGDAYARGGTFTWKETATSPDDGGIGQITRVRVQKRTMENTWVAVLDQVPGYGPNEIVVAAPADPQTLLTLETRRVGTSTWSAVPASALPDFGLAHRYDATALGTGNFEYKVTARDAGQTAVRQVASGTVSITMPPLAAITTPLAFGAHELGGGLGRYRSTVLAWAHPADSTLQTLRYRVAGTTQPWNQLAIRRYNDGTKDGVDCSVLASGSYEFELVWSTVGQGIPTHHATGTVTIVPGQPSVWVPPSGTPNITGLYLQVVDTSTEWSSILRPPPPDVWLNWDACNANIARAYNGSTWVTLLIDNSSQEGSSFSSLYDSWSGQQRAKLNSLGTGTWYIELYRTNASTTKYATATYTVTSTGTRSLTVTTQPYTPGYWTQAVPPQYLWSVNTPASSPAISTADGAVLTQSSGQNTGNQWLRPVVKQNTDRWGNVLSITDPRSEQWATTYRYNANNQMVRQVQPQASDLGAPVSEIYYDALGRQVAVRDANGYVNGQTFDAAGNLVQELHADTGVVTNTYDAFGRRTRTVDAEGHAVTFRYDALGNLLEVDKGPLPVYFNVGNSVAARSFADAVKDRWKYDQLGQRLTFTNGNGEVLTYKYDLRGNIVETKQPLGQKTRSAFDAQGRKIGEVDANLFAASWRYDYFGRLLDHTDLGGARYAYTYDRAQQLVRQTNTRNQSLQYGYDTAGQLVQLTDFALGQVSTYMYDAAGRRIREQVVQQGTTYQDNHLAYDAIGNLRRVSDARADIKMEYDRVGNRTFVGNYVIYASVKGATSTSEADRHFLYDKMNRQVVVDAYSAAGDIGPDRGHVITYDRNGNRKTDTAWRTSVRSTTGASPIRYFNDTSDGTAVQDVSLSYVKEKFKSTEEYRYDAANRLWSIVRDGVQVDHRRYDAADRLLFSGPASLPPNYRSAVQVGLTGGGGDGLEQTYNRYDKNGRLVHQDVFNSDGSARVQVSWDPSENLGLIAPGYDEVGNSKGYVVRDVKSGAVTRYATTFRRFEGHQADLTVGTSTVMDPGSIRQGYDANGFLVSVTDSTNSTANRTFVNDSAGRALYVDQGGSVQRQLVANGEVLGIYGVANGASLVDFDFGYAPITNTYPNAAPGTYVIRSGDTLQSIAQSAYGDSALWYRIAEANGVMTNNDLKVGQTLNIPNRVSTIHNNDSTFKPYDPSRITGDMTPNLPAPEKGCGGAGAVLMVVVAVVVAVWTGGAATGLIGNAMAGGATAGGISAASVAAIEAVSVIAGSAIGGAAGSIASQAVGRAVGVIDNFSWTNVALSAVSAGVSAGLGANASESFATGTSGAAAGEAVASGSAAANLARTSRALAVVGHAVASNVIAQGISVVTGLQRKFDWRGVIASGLGAWTGHVFGEGLRTDFGGTNRPPFADLGAIGGVLRGGISGLAGGVFAAAARGGRVIVQQIAADAFGNALGSSLASASNGTSERPGVGPWSDRDYVNGMDLQSDQAYEARRAQEWIAQSDAIQSRRLYESTAANAQDKFRATERAYRQELETARQVNGLDLPSDYIFAQQNMPSDVDLDRAHRQILSGEAAASAHRPREAGAGRGFVNPAAAAFGADTAVQTAQDRLATAAQVPADAARASMADYWTRMEDAGVDGRSFGKYIFGKTMRAFGNFAYDAGDALVGALERPADIRDGAYKVVANFGPDSFNGAANLLKGSLNGWTLLAEKLGLPEGQFAGFRSSNPFNIDPLFSYDNKTQAGAGLLASLGLGGATAKFGGYGLVFEDIGAAGPMASQMGAVRISLVTANASAGRLLVVNREGMLYPEIPDLRTGRPIQFPEGELARVDKAARASWDSSADRYAFIKEWNDRGYVTPPGGWKQYDIHHVRPLEFGGTNTFWNLAPIQRQTHVQMFNKFWRGY